MEGTWPTTVSTPGRCSCVTFVAGRPTSRTSVAGTAARMRGAMAVASHSAPSMLGGYPRVPWKSTTGGPPAAGFPAGRRGRGYVLGITVTLDSPDRAASRSLAITTRSTCAATDRWNRRQSLPLSRAWYQAKRARTEFCASAGSQLVRQQFGPEPGLDVLEVHQIHDGRAEVGPSRPFVRGRGREPHHVIGRTGPVAQGDSGRTVGSGHDHLEREAPAGRPFQAPSEWCGRARVRHALRPPHRNCRWHLDLRSALVVEDEQIEVGHRCHGLHDLGQADEAAPERRPRHVVGHQQ